MLLGGMARNEHVAWLPYCRQTAVKLKNLSKQASRLCMCAQRHVCACVSKAPRLDLPHTCVGNSWAIKRYTLARTYIRACLLMSERASTLSRLAEMGHRRTKAKSLGPRTESKFELQRGARRLYAANGRLKPPRRIAQQLVSFSWCVAHLRRSGSIVRSIVDVGFPPHHAAAVQAARAPIWIRTSGWGSTRPILLQKSLYCRYTSTSSSSTSDLAKSYDF